MTTYLTPTVPLTLAQKEAASILIYRQLLATDFSGVIVNQTSYSSLPYSPTTVADLGDVFYRALKLSQDFPPPTITNTLSGEQILAAGDLLFRTLLQVDYVAATPVSLLPLPGTNMSPADASAIAYNILWRARTITNPPQSVQPAH
jgi:hypothetical protein